MVVSDGDDVGPAHKPARGDDTEVRWERQAGCSARRAGSSKTNERLRHNFDDTVGEAILGGIIVSCWVFK